MDAEEKDVTIDNLTENKPVVEKDDKIEEDESETTDIKSHKTSIGSDEVPEKLNGKVDPEISTENNVVDKHDVIAEKRENSSNKIVCKTEKEKSVVSSKHTVNKDTKDGFLKIGDNVKSYSRDEKAKLERTDRYAHKRLTLPTKIVVRRLPPTMTKDEFLSQVSPVPDYDHIKFTEPDNSYFPHCFSRIYINFVNVQDVYQFKDKFDNYVFVDAKGNEYPAVVEFAFFQRTPKKRSTRKKDLKCGTIESDPHYLSFLESLAEEIVPDDKREFNYQQPSETKKDVSTPLVDFVNQRRREKFRIREERKEERKRRETDRKKMREEEKRRRRMAAKEYHHREQVSTKDNLRISRGVKERRDVDIPKEAPAVKESGKDVDDNDADVNDKDSTNDDLDRENDSSKLENVRADRPVLSREFKKSTMSKKPSDSYGKKYVDKNDQSRKDRDRDRPYEKNYGGRDSQKYYSKSSDTYGKSKYISNKPNSRTVSNTRIVKSSRMYSKYEPSKYTNKFEHGSSSKSKESSAKTSDVQEDKNVNNEETSCERVSENGQEEKHSASDNAETKNSNSDDKDDPRKQRRIRNKDRPTLEIYRPGMGRLSKEKKTSKGEDEQQKKVTEGE